MHDLALLLGVLLLSYLVGAIPFGYVIARSRGVDILRQGSGNIGATNVGRVLGRRFGVLVLLLDFSKGALPAAGAAWLGRMHEFAGVESFSPGILPVAAGLAAFLGHLFPVYLRFRGGKGVATGAGVVAVLLPGPAVGAALVWLATLVASRYASLASLTGAAALCGFRWWTTPEPLALANRTLSAFCLIAASLVIVRHHANIGRLLRGSENRLEDSSGMRQLSKVIHVLALGLWFGSGIFFTFVAALVLFQTFESLGDLPANQRSPWLPLPTEFRKEDGTKLAGVAVSPLFPWYFIVQGVCGLLALATALSWNRLEPGRRLHRLRSQLLLLAMAGVLVGWPLVQRVSELRLARYSSDDSLAAAARQAFGSWHTASLLLNMVTLLFVGVALALAAWLPVAMGPGEEKI